MARENCGNQDITEAISFGDNSFDFIRLIAALTVVWGHATLHLELSESDAVSYVHSFVGFFPGVVAFFGISGFLICASLDNNLKKNGHSNGLRVYARSRFLRIYPALWAALVVSLATIATLYGLPHASEFIPWLAAQLTIGQFYTPDFFRGFGVGTPNGSLWTITVEIQFYIVIVLLYPLLKQASNKQWSAVLIFGGVLSVVNDYAGLVLPTLASKLLGVTILPYLYMFLLGSFLYFRKDSLLVWLRDRVHILLGIYVAVSIVVFLSGARVPGTYRSIWIGYCVPVIVVALSYRLGRHRLSFDISYGVYIYHMIVINVLVQLGMIGSYGYFAAALVFTIALAFISWFGVEKPCLSRKKVTLLK